MSADILRILVVLLGIIVVAVVLFQQPKEGGMSAFTGGGGGASGTIFGAKGSGSFLFKLTAGAALLFAVLVIALVKVSNTNTSAAVLSQPEAVAKGIPGETPVVPTAAENAIPGSVEQKTPNKE